MLYVDLDFETRSLADLRLIGVDVYARDPTTEIICLSYEAYDNKFRWFPGDPPDRLLTLIEGGYIFVAHNAGFEQAIWRHIMVPDFGFPPIPLERWEDTMATAAYKSCPLALDKLQQALHLPFEKDMEGRKFTLDLSKFGTKKAHEEEYPGPEWGTKKAWGQTFIKGMLPALTPKVRRRAAEYCDRDVEVETSSRHRLGLLSTENANERGVWLLDQRINQRGLRIDLGFVRQAQRVVDRAIHELRGEFDTLTGGLAPGQVDKVKGWCESQGLKLDNLQKGTIEKVLALEPESTDPAAGYDSLAGDDDGDHMQSVAELPPHVRRVLEIRQMLGSASIKKLARMQACVGSDGRARGLLQYHAAHSGRWGGRLFQPQNFPRGSLKVDPETAVETIMSGNPNYVEAVLGVPAIEAVASSLRHALIPDPGKVFMVGDFAGIEMRIVLALAGQDDVLRVVASGDDVYLRMACDIYNVPQGSLTKADVEKRQTGKNSMLGCGFQMGPSKFHARYCPEQPVEFAERVVETYRKTTCPDVPRLWYAFDDAAVRAVRSGHPVESYGVVWQLVEHGEWLVAVLPNGWQRVWYHRPTPIRDERFDRQAWQFTAYKGGHPTRVNAYGGLETENIVQALARGLLVAAMMRLERAAMPLVLTVHDECVAEVDEDKADLVQFERTMMEPTAWSEKIGPIGVPIAVESWQGGRYKK